MGRAVSVPHSSAVSEICQFQRVAYSKLKPTAEDTWDDVFPLNHRVFRSLLFMDSSSKWASWEMTFLKSTSFSSLRWCSAASTAQTGSSVNCGHGGATWPHVGCFRAENASFPAPVSMSKVGAHGARMFWMNVERNT